MADKLGAPAPIFPRIDADKEQELLARLGMLEQGPQSALVPASTSVPETGSPSAASYEDFAKLDLRVGTVVEAERVPGKDKLLALRVDVGEGAPRSIVAGLAQSFRPEELLGTKVVVIANLEPRKFGKNLVSHGMLLATGPSDALRLVTVGEGAPAGAKVK
jgi:methionyl-tRNA synthetase